MNKDAIMLANWYLKRAGVYVTAELEQAAQRIIADQPAATETYWPSAPYQREDREAHAKLEAIALVLSDARTLVSRWQDDADRYGNTTKASCSRELAAVLREDIGFVERPEDAQALADVAFLDAAACRYGTRLDIPSKIPGFDPGDADHIHFVLMPIGAAARRAAVEWLKRPGAPLTYDDATEQERAEIIEATISQPIKRQP